MYHGFMLGILASVTWGITPVFFKAMDDFTTLEVVAHRVVWTMVVMLVFGYFTHRLPRLRLALTTPKELASIVMSSLMVSLNWLVYIYAVASNQIIEASLGYYIYPLMVVAVGVLGLGEKLTRKEALAVTLAFMGVMLKTYEGGGAPLIALIVSASFTIYTLLGKTRNTGPVVGLLAEVIVVVPLALVYLIVLAASGTGQFITGGGANTGLAVFTGVVTALPLAMYIASSRAIGMAIAGLLFYLAPSLQLVIGVMIYDEPFSQLDALAFGFIWLALMVLVWPRRAKA